ncbi:hypothetical protein C2845_PM05G24200 [Panicum miliaceum]|uniref:RNase H type-1 domain-containing protein n=1 Tax=Panicum miliaceum TaxID=4540 RepID=A0A3L6T3V0_PANMI|nr:hypothetical protein C2845_PM05G24200 [Panicum miliaceum]
MEEQRKLLSEMNSPNEVLHYILQMKGEEQMKMIVLLWKWWNERNRIREGEKGRETQDLVYLFQKNAQDFLNLGSTEEEAMSRPAQRWQKPTEDFIKINSDGAFLANTGEGGWGYVIRDGDGEVICAGAGPTFHTNRMRFKQR